MEQIEAEIIPRQNFHCIDVPNHPNCIPGIFLTEQIKLIILDLESYAILSAYENYSSDAKKIAEHLNLNPDSVYNTLREFTSYVRDLEQQNPLKSQSTARIVINVSQDCNLRCTYCYAQGGSYGEQRNLMNKETADLVCNNIIEAFKIGSFFGIQYFGGEPLLNLEIMEYITNRLKTHYGKNSPFFSMVTNGTVFSEKIHQFIRKHINSVTISLDGKKAVNDVFRKSKADKWSVHDKVVETIRKLNQDRTFSLSLEATFNPVHFEKQVSIEDLMEYFKSLGVDSTLITPVGPPIEFSKEQWPSVIREFSHAIPKVFKIAEESNGGFYHSKILNYILALQKRQDMPYLCAAGVATYAFGVDGKLYPCYTFVGNSAFVRGTLSNGDNKVLSRAIQELKIEMNTKSLKKKNIYCSNCWTRSVCSSCISYLYGKTGNAFLPDQGLCDLEREMIDTTFRELLRLKKTNPVYWKNIMEQITERWWKILKYS